MKRIVHLLCASGLAWLAISLEPGLSQTSAADDSTHVATAKKKIVFLAGPPSHGYAAHEYYAGCALLAKCIRDNVPGAEAIVYKGWPKQPGALDDAATIVISWDGTGNHVAAVHRVELEPLMKKGVGMACLHWAVEIPKGPPADFLRHAIGGCFEPFWSVNPFWTAKFTTFPRHPVANGLKPFEIEDEWYFNMRFPDGMKGVTPILSATPPDKVFRNENTGYGGNPHVYAQGHARGGRLGRGAAGRRAGVWFHGRTRALELGMRQLPQGRAQRHRLDCRHGRSAQRGALGDADVRRAGGQPGQTAASGLQQAGRAQTYRRFPAASRDDALTVQQNDTMSTGTPPST